MDKTRAEPCREGSLKDTKLEHSRFSDRFTSISCHHFFQIRIYFRITLVSMEGLGTRLK